MYKMGKLFLLSFAIYAVITTFGITALFWSKARFYPEYLFILGIFLAMIGFHELGHCIVSLLIGYNIKKPFLSILYLGIEIEPDPRNTLDAFILYSASLLGIPACYIVGFFMFNSYFALCFSILSFVFCIPDIIEFILWRKRLKK